MRKPTKLTPEDGIFYKISKKGTCEITLGKVDETTIQHVTDIIKKFIKIKNVKKHIEVTDEEIKLTARKWGYDLKSVSLRLEAWKFEKGIKLSEIKDESVYDYFWLPSGKLQLERLERRRILTPISALCQFEPLSVYVDFLHSIDSTTVIEVEQKGFIQRKRWKGKYFFTIPEGEAKWILKTLSYKISSHYVKNQIKEIFKEYIKSKPPNWAYVFYDLYLVRYENHLAKEILFTLLHDNEIWMIANELGVQSSLSEALPFLQVISTIDSQQKYIQEFWVNYIKHKGGIISVINEIRNLKMKTWRLYQLYNLIPVDELKKEVLSNLNRRLKSSTARIINSELASLHKDWKIDFLAFFGSFSSTDWINIINKSTLKSIRTLFGNFIEHRKLEQAPFLVRFAEALVDEKVDWNRLITEGKPSLYRLCGLIQFVERVSPRYARVLINKLSELDLNELFSRDDPVAIEKGISKARSLNGLHTETYKLSIFHSWKKIIERVNDETWRNIFHSSDMEENFWLLWNIRRHDVGKAKQLAKRYKDLFMTYFLKPIFPLSKALTFSGILHYCDINIQKIKIKTNFKKVMQILDNLRNKKYPSCTQIILILTTLKIKCPHYFRFFRTILNDSRIMSCIHHNKLEEFYKKLIQNRH